MLLARKPSAYFVVADPLQTDGRFIEALEFHLNLAKVTDLIERARAYYERAILPALQEKFLE